MLILDASVILNLLGTGRPKLLLESLNYKVFAPPGVLKEIQREPLPNFDRDADLAALLDINLISVVEITVEIELLAIELAGAPSPDDLDDGEAYAIASAVLMGGAVAIDESKGRRILAQRWPKLAQMFTIDLIEEVVVRRQLPSVQYADIVFNALRNSRMRVPKNKRVDIISLIGKERAKLCPSLGIVM